MKLYNEILFFFGFWLLAFGIIKGQNLVLNGNFENHSACPNTTQLNLATGWFVAGGTPEYYNSCATNSFLSVPRNFAGYQSDCCNGMGYAGEYLMCNYSTLGDDSCREYIGTKLIDSLKAGHKYVAGMYVSRANFNYSLVTIGMLFTDTAIVLPNPANGPLLHANPQVKNVTPLTDTLNWVLVCDTFIAVGGETYLTIGNFNTTATSDTIISSGNWWYNDDGTYYFIDSVSVYDLTAMGINALKNRDKELKIYPNPANATLQVSGIKYQEEIKIYDLLGNEIPIPNPFQRKGNSTTIDVSNLPNGVYFLQVKTTEGVFSKKIIVQH